MLRDTDAQTEAALYKRLSRTVAKLGLSTEEIARRTGLSDEAIRNLRRGRTRPYARTIARLLPLLSESEATPYLRLAQGRRVRIDCSRCPAPPLLLYPSQLRSRLRLIAQGLARPLKQLGPYHYRGRCRRCASHATGKETSRWNAAFKKQQRVFAKNYAANRKRGSNGHGDSIGLGQILSPWRFRPGRKLGRSKSFSGKFNVCPVCLTPVHISAAHRICLRRWDRVAGHRPGSPAIVLRPRKGRRPSGQSLMDGYVALLDRINGMTRLRSAAERAAARGDRKPISDGGVGTLKNQIACFIDLVSDWSLTFPLPRHRAGNERRQAVYPLPESLNLNRAAPIGEGERDARALRLHCLTFTDEEAARHTGLPLERVRLVVAHFASARVARVAKLTDLSEWVIRRGRRVSRALARTSRCVGTARDTPGYARNYAREGTPGRTSARVGEGWKIKNLLGNLAIYRAGA
jgi:transcriptional regulator with XRE-family HTH domain